MIALALGLAVAATSPPEPVVKEDLNHHWHPGRDQVAWVEQHLQVPERMGGPITNFDRFYTGLYRNGHRVIAVELVRLGEWHGGAKAVHIVSPNQVPAIGDGGCGILHFSYDVSTGATSSLECNFDLPPPPPPER